MIITSCNTIQCQVDYSHPTSSIPSKSIAFSKLSSSKLTIALILSFAQLFANELGGRPYRSSSPQTAKAYWDINDIIKNDNLTMYVPSD